MGIRERVAGRVVRRLFVVSGVVFLVAALGFAAGAVASPASRRDAAALFVSLLLAACVALGWVVTALIGRLRARAIAAERIAFRDRLTGLATRVRFGVAVDAALPPLRDQPVAVGLVHLDGFKEVNEILGHDNGDELLVIIGQRLEHAVRTGDVVARFGGNEFALALVGVADERQAAEMLAHLRRVVAEPLIIDGLPIALEASVGYALSPDDGSDADGLVRRAEAAMHIAKQHRSGALRYAATRTTYDASALTLLAELGPAIERGQLVLHYQAKGDLTRRAVTGVEALLRWNHPRHGLIYPDSFVPRAEQTELIDAVTRWVLAEACRAVAEIDALAERTIAVNVSARSLCRVGFAEEVIATLAEHGTDPRRIVIEITETSLMSDPTAAGDTVRALHEAGLRISIDDFGAGQTSLEYLAMLPVDELKIDKSFVLGMVADQRKATIVRSVVGLGHALGLSVTAEGVETREHLNRLGGFGCDKAQGYLLARPCAAEDLAAALDAAEAVLERRTNLGRPGGRGAGVARAHRPRTEPATVVGAPGDGA